MKDRDCDLHRTQMTLPRRQSSLYWRLFWWPLQQEHRSLEKCLGRGRYISFLFAFEFQLKGVSIVNRVFVFCFWPAKGQTKPCDLKFLVFDLTNQQVHTTLLQTIDVYLPNVLNVLQQDVVFNFKTMHDIKTNLQMVINPLSLGVKLQILLLCFHTFLTEVVGRSCQNINRI